MVRVEIICEDRGHDFFFSPLLRRLLSDRGVDHEINTFSDKRGYPGVKRALQGYFSEYVREKGLPDILVIVYDADRKPPAELRAEILSKVHEQYHALICICCCIPHVERFYLLDFHAFRVATGFDGNQPSVSPRGDFKQKFRDLTEAAVGVAPLGGLENAKEIVELIDLERFRQADSQARSFVTCVERRVNEMLQAQM
jgi:hypothetical protein